MSALTIGGTQTGGTVKTLTPAGVDGSGRFRFVFPEHTALSQRMLTVGVNMQPVSKNSLGVQQVTVDFALTEAAPSETCCSVISGGVFANLKLRWDLSQPSSLVDTLLSYLQGAAFAQFLSDAIKKGVVSL